MYVCVSGIATSSIQSCELALKCNWPPYRIRSLSEQDLLSDRPERILLIFQSAHAHTIFVPLHIMHVLQCLLGGIFTYIILCMLSIIQA